MINNTDKMEFSFGEAAAVFYGIVCCVTHLYDLFFRRQSTVDGFFERTRVRRNESPIAAMQPVTKINTHNMLSFAI